MVEDIESLNKSVACRAKQLFRKHTEGSASDFQAHLPTFPYCSL